jgi:hypothetical protein
MPKDDNKSDDDYTRRVMKARNLEEVNNTRVEDIIIDSSRKERKERK